MPPPHPTRPDPFSLCPTAEVCGPSGGNEKTYDSYCQMLVVMCNAQGGPDRFKPIAAPSAKKGPCPTTSPPTTPGRLSVAVCCGMLAVGTGHPG